MLFSVSHSYAKVPSNSLKANSIGGVTQKRCILGGKYSFRWLLEFGAYDVCSQCFGPDCWYSQTALPQQIVLAENKNSRALKLFCAPKKKSLCCLSRSQQHTVKRRNWFVFCCKSTVIDCGWVLKRHFHLQNSSGVRELVAVGCLLLYRC